MLETIEDIEATAEHAVTHGYQLNTHAIGDRAVREVLDLLSRWRQCETRAEAAAGGVDRIAACLDGYRIREAAALLRAGLVVGGGGAVTALAVETLSGKLEPLSRSMFGAGLAFVGGAVGPACSSTPVVACGNPGAT